MVEHQALAALVDKVDGDIRSCLTTLMFLHTQKKEVLAKDIERLAVGRKDITKSFFDVWDTTFRLPRSKAGRRSLGGAMGVSAAGRDIYSRLDTLMIAQDQDFILQGCHENLYCHSRGYDILNKLSSSLDWISSSDCISRKALLTGSFGLKRYMQTSLGAVHSLMACPEKPKIDFPREHTRVRQEKDQHESLLGSWRIGTSPRLAASLTSGIAVTDI